MKIDSDSREVTMSWGEAMVLVNVVLQGQPDDREVMLSLVRCINQFSKFAMSKGDKEQTTDIVSTFPDGQVFTEATAN